MSYLLICNIKMSSHKLPTQIAEAINATATIESIGEDLQSFLETNDPKIVFEVFTQIIKGCNSKSSWVVDNATKLLERLLHTQNQLITAQFNSEEFQKALMYTLRGKTTRFGNKFSMHRQTWKIIEERVLSFYSVWHKEFMLQQNKVPNIIKNYKLLKSYKIKFPEETNIIDNEPNIESKQLQNINTGDKICLQTEKESLQTFLYQYQKIVNQGIDSSIVDSIQFKIKEKLIYALNSVLLYEESNVRLQVAMFYNKRFNDLIQKLNQTKKHTSSSKTLKAVSSKEIPVTSQPKQKATSTPTKTSGIRSLIKSTIAFLSSQPTDSKDSQVKEKVMSKLDQTIGDLVKYFDNHQEIEIDIHDIPTMTKSNLY